MVRAPDVAGRQCEGQLAPSRLAQAALIHPLLEQVQLRFAHGAFESEQQPVVILSRVVDAVQVRDEGAKERTDLQQAMPIGIRAGQPRHLHAQDEPDMPQADLGDQALKAGAADRASCPTCLRSSSMTRTRSVDQPSASARATKPYCNRVDSWWTSTCWAVDCRT